ncbi:MAG: hypothetical protein NTU84_05415, partial [Verrucomicrobia bacterium]|nr:hypothetical protein [Verrucomicrobiota bacterium]
PFARVLQHRIRYFTDGAVIGSRIFVDEAFANSRSRFGPKRNSGARKMRGNASAASPLIYSMRDLRKGIGLKRRIANSTAGFNIATDGSGT